MRERGKSKRARTSGAPSAAAKRAAPAPPLSQEHDTSAIYGLYSCQHEDFCSGAWFPCSYVGPVNGAAAASSSSSSAAAASPSPADSILVRWQSNTAWYDPEPLSMAFVRGGSEFTRLEIAHQKVGKRVLVRDCLQDMDFSGVSFWLATIREEPVVPPSAASSSSSASTGPGRKRSSASLAEPTVAVEYQNRMWPACSVPCSSIFVLPKVKKQLELVPEVETEELRQKRARWVEEQARLRRERGEADSEEEDGGVSDGGEEGEVRGGAPASATAAAAAHSSSSSLLPLVGEEGELHGSSPRPFAFSSPAAGVDDAHLQLSPPLTPATSGGPASAVAPGSGGSARAGGAGLMASQLTDSDAEDPE